MKYLIVGLGNPGAEYENTRHNAGFMALDRLASRSGATFASARYAQLAEMKHRGRRLILIKPSTYMNLSGKAVRYWMQEEKIALDHVLIIVDDLALPVGSLRLRAKGADAGHNGLKDIAAQLGGTNYARLRIGIGSGFARGHQVDFVLGAFPPEERALLDQTLDRAADAVGQFATIGVSRAMNQVNTTPREKGQNGDQAQAAAPCE
ncbi:MAG: aminoacyl-tRNA hydrolase [Bacteroidia bacterium]|nr:MAG: aminoacyl-tRNA hydrolase [Bacteroidia bacterium]